MTAAARGVRRPSAEVIGHGRVLGYTKWRDSKSLYLYAAAMVVDLEALWWKVEAHRKPVEWVEERADRHRLEEGGLEGGVCRSCSQKLNVSLLDELDDLSCGVPVLVRGSRGQVNDVAGPRSNRKSLGPGDRVNVRPADFCAATTT